jgi:hypothetical protein
MREVRVERRWRSLAIGRPGKNTDHCQWPRRACGLVPSAEGEPGESDLLRAPMLTSTKGHSTAEVICALRPGRWVDEY